ncbi:MAG: hypothetical protein DRG09_02350 [Epsilonproteobacteria bacterium]|nr:MAG: hypothetical protein DRG09_02350 [Campylobacterota bacterium]
MIKTSAYVCMVMMFCVQLLHAQPTQSDKVLKKFDKNNDDRISFSEAPNHIQESFHRHDINRDGYISGTELRSMSSRPSSHRPPPHQGHRPTHHPGPPRRPPPR